MRIPISTFHENVIKALDAYLLTMNIIHYKVLNM